MLWKKKQIEQDKEYWDDRAGRERIGSSDPMERVPFEQRLVGSEGVSHADIWRKTLPSRGNS